MPIKLISSERIPCFGWFGFQPLWAVPSLGASIMQRKYSSIGYQILGWLYELTTVILEARKWHSKSSSRSYIWTNWHKFSSSTLQNFNHLSNSQAMGSIRNIMNRDGGSDVPTNVTSNLEVFISRDLSVEVSITELCHLLKWLFVVSIHKDGDLKDSDILKRGKWVSPWCTLCINQFNIKIT